MVRARRSLPQQDVVLRLEHIVEFLITLRLKGYIMSELEKFYGPNAGYVLELYERYLQNPASVDAVTRAIFDSWASLAEEEQPQLAKEEGASGNAPFQVSQVVAASALAHAIRDRGHLGAHLDPLGTEPLGDPNLLPESH